MEDKIALQEEIERRKELNISDLAQIKTLRARITELETAGLELNSLLNSTMSWMQEEGIKVPFVMSVMIGSLGEKSEKFAALLKG